MTRESDLNDRTWQEWTPRIPHSKEDDEWPEFQQWCEQWAGWTNITVRYLTQDEVAEAECKPVVEDWRTQVYGGKKATTAGHGQSLVRGDSRQNRQREAQGEAQRG